MKILVATKTGFPIAVSLLGLISFTLGSTRVEAGAFLIPGLTPPNPDIVTHAPNYSGTGGEIVVTVCIDPMDPNAATLETPVKNVVSAFNAFAPVTQNLQFGASNNIPATSFDFESVMLHEVGHCLGLGHPNLASESGLPTDEQDSTATQDGANTMVDVDAGTDTLFGSSDDVRSDDVNLQWYTPGVNNPFLLPAVVDSSTYSRTGALPGGHLFAANADRQVGAALGLADTEAVMQQGTFNDEAQRVLANDDVATLMYAGVGYDETAGTADDYTVELQYVGLTTSCDISVIPATSGLAFCGVGLTSSVQNHWRVTSGTIEYNSNFADWFFNSDLACLDIALDWPHNQMLRHSVCGDISLTSGFSVGTAGIVTLEGDNVIFQNGTSVADGGELTVMNP
ncbi:MAG: hypothetical protein ACR2QZ_07855 [Woeseiaceae bacterium]